MADGALPSTLEVNALRDSFGDRKPPDITRKITACVACRKQKVSPFTVNLIYSDTLLNRCVNRSLQTLLEQDVTWKGAVAQKIKRLEDAISRIADKVDIHDLGIQSQNEEHLDSTTPPAVDMTNAEEFSPSPKSPPRVTQRSKESWEVTLDPRGGPASIPASCLSGNFQSNQSASVLRSRRPDLISNGLINMRQALALFDTYHLRLDHFLYRILGDHISLDSVRGSSNLLTAAVCTVGALHSPSQGHLFETCYSEFKSLVASQIFSRQANEDDIRGLCIGAFWLHELSWALIGNAVRVASDINLHTGIYKALRGDREGYMQARLYYLVYVCDHHFSIAYGRPPMSREGFIIDSASKLLETDNATEDDARLISQVKEWSILGQVFDTFGVDVDTAIQPQIIPQLRRYSIALDTWHADWIQSFQENCRVGNYPAKGVGFHFHFAKLYLCSHAFRGIPALENAAGYFSPELEEIANSGVLSAMSILRVIVSDAEFRSFLNGLPLYFDTMLAFAVVFLLKVATKYATAIRIDTDKIMSLVSQTIIVLREVTQVMHHQHLLVTISEGLEKLLLKCQAPAQPAQRVTVYPASPATYPQAQFDTTWMESMANFDFHSNFPDLDDWWLHSSIALGSTLRTLPPGS
ncbi:hypothetical protein N7450_006823 [Penicillium hetheringtonii]|uniref:Xylanolytic transcriptional activator regulatory domain-containing protein n=1 Tax=Penicillium hetheringtonii TaxID=911720 RepID=A0AAD6DGG4_9EURO|nr:hypothetical protein N7450_006823 [Penicillium hetheringtonii]